ncbi:CLUMA_CG020663, isoform A [Clunio marinus]|uniref:CLUMA_CG020663, isoform A n=1 Tax=Clunio marinus TaxID=568069 RepID=A0A1J1J8A7_9DIPT|nr:CLUMA_CG020663, isoform A [Clunio marinus]
MASTQRIVTKTDDGRYVIINPDGRSVPLKLANSQKETSEPKKYIVKSSSGQVIVASQGGVKTEKPSTSSSIVGTASSITIGKKAQPSSNVIKITSPTSPTGKNVQVVRVLNSGASSSGTQKVIQVPRSNAPRILNQSIGTSDVKEEQSQRPVTVVRKVISDSEDSPPVKKTKYITLTTSQINQIEGATIMGGGKSKRIVMLPSNYREQLEKISTRPTQATSGQTTFKIVQETRSPPLEIDPVNQFSVGRKSKRPCNCTKSQCLKFYCDCFAAGEYCSGCNCKDCLNEHDSEERERAVKMCMERNPFAFKSKEATEEQQRLHQRGCNCKRSGCLKNYCECYEAKISCSANCRCLGCKNVDDVDEKMEMELQYLKQCGKRGQFNEEIYEKNLAALKKVTDLNEIVKKPYNFMTQDVIEATVQCMIAQAEECEKINVTKKQGEKMILEEFSRCLQEIIEFSAKNID